MNLALSECFFVPTMEKIRIPLILITYFNKIVREKNFEIIEFHDSIIKCMKKRFEFRRLQYYVLLLDKFNFSFTKIR